MKQTQRMLDTQREVVDWLQGRGQIGVLAGLGILAVVFVIFVIGGLLA